MLLLFTTAIAAKAHFYVAGGINIAKTIAAGATGLASYSQDAAGNFPVSETRTNKRGANGVGFTGRCWLPISTHNTLVNASWWSFILSEFDAKRQYAQHLVGFELSI